MEPTSIRYKLIRVIAILLIISLVPGTFAFALTEGEQALEELQNEEFIIDDENIFEQQNMTASASFEVSNSIQLSSALALSSSGSVINIRDSFTYNDEIFIMGSTTITMNLNGNTLNIERSGMGIYVISGATLIVSGPGTLNVINNDLNIGPVIQAWQNAKIINNGATINATGAGGVQVREGSEATVTNVTGTNFANAGVEGDNSKLIVTGNVENAVFASLGGEVIINGNVLNGINANDGGIITVDGSVSVTDERIIPISLNGTGRTSPNIVTINGSVIPPDPNSFIMFSINNFQDFGFKLIGEYDNIVTINGNSYLQYLSPLGELNGYVLVLLTGEPPSTVPTTVPSAIRNLTSTVGNRSVTLRWTDPDNGASQITHYQIRRRTGTGAWGSWQTIHPTETTHTVTGLVNDRAYGFQIRAVNEVGAAPDSNIRNATPRTQRPAEITNLTATPGNGRVTLRWTAPNNGGASITSYQFRQRVGSGGWSSWRALSGSGSSRAVTGLTNGREMSFEVRAVNARGNAPASNTAEAMPVGPPTAVRNLRATAGNTQVTLRWAAPTTDGGSEIVRYELRQQVNNGRWSAWRALDDLSTTHTVTGLVNGRSYGYQVRAVSARGNGAVSNTSTARLQLRAPAAITDLTATPGDTTVTLAWSHPANGGSAITSYQVRQQAENGSWSAWRTLPRTSRTFTASNLLNDTTYNFQVRAVNARGNGGVANTTAIPVAPAPAY